MVNPIYSNLTFRSRPSAALNVFIALLSFCSEICFNTIVCMIIFVVLLRHIFQIYITTHVSMCISNVQTVS